MAGNYEIHKSQDKTLGKNTDAVTTSVTEERSERGRDNCFFEGPSQGFPLGPLPKAPAAGSEGRQVIGQDKVDQGGRYRREKDEHGDQTFAEGEDSRKTCLFKNCENRPELLICDLHLVEPKSCDIVLREDIQLNKRDPICILIKQRWVGSSLVCYLT